MIVERVSRFFLDVFFLQVVSTTSKKKGVLLLDLFECQDRIRCSKRSVCVSWIRQVRKCSQNLTLLEFAHYRPWIFGSSLR